MNMISMEPRIIDLDGYAHLIKDKFICFERGLFDLSDPEDLAFLSEYADTLYATDGQPKYYGRDSVCVLSVHPEGGYHTFQYDVHELPESSRKAIKEAQHEFGV